MRLKFLLVDGHRTVDVHEYRFSKGPPASVRFRTKDDIVENVDISADVFVTNDRGDTIDRLVPKKESKG